MIIVATSSSGANRALVHAYRTPVENPALLQRCAVVALSQLSLAAVLDWRVAGTWRQAEKVALWSPTRPVMGSVRSLQLQVGGFDVSPVQP
ncbi:hypothetical protein NDU88_004383 [Pleurodeles waltl]|uniref:Uncharacterized protein n=1 Tax=Pleurodeles waltl TaxID=8319 RepID=A0AAV7KXJ9_PLEWA|nr:hypothetical protein NDU88_004383 [Pleurodeles waltl]